jgi:hypothetical protein
VSARTRDPKAIFKACTHCSFSLLAVSKTRRLPVADIEDAHLKGDWLPDTVRDGAIHTLAYSDTERSKLIWTAEQVETFSIPLLYVFKVTSQIWGFESINDERRYTRRVKFNCNDGQELHEIRLVYDRL